MCIIMEFLKSKQPFFLENGSVLQEIDIAYHTYGQLNESGDNVIWVCHALTANSDAAEWWSGLIGENKLFDPTESFIVCANMLGSCYGATNANSINPLSGERYGANFPLITIRDIVNSHRILQKHLNINKIRLGIGGSMGGQQVLEWSIIDPYLFEQTIILAAGAKLTAWSRGLNAAQRLALESDITLYEHSPNAGKKGLEAARAIGMLSYRSYESYNFLQKDEDDGLEQFKVDSYLRYQGAKLSKRFTALSYLSVTKSMDSHNVGRNRGGIEKALQTIRIPTLVIGIESDLLFPIEEQIELARFIPNSQLEIIESPYGHDGFLIEYEQIIKIITRFLAQLHSNIFLKSLRLAAA